MKKNIIVLLFFLSLLVIIPISSIVVSQPSTDIRSKAAQEKILPVLPPLSPFVRVGKSKDRVKKGELVPVYVSAKTNGQSIVEAEISLSYDPEQLILEEKNIRNDGVFPTLNIVSVEPGKAVFSLFVNTDIGYSSIELSEEKTIATLFFVVTGDSGAGEVKLTREGDAKTALYGLRDPETGLAPDILSSTQDVIIHIE